MLDRFAAGQVYESSLDIDGPLLRRFAELSGDDNPIHLDAEQAKAYGFPRPIAHGAILSALLSRIIGNQIPGPGALWLNQSIEWVSPVYEGDQVKISATIAKVSAGSGVIHLMTGATNQKGAVVMKGHAEVMVTQRLTGQPQKESGGPTSSIIQSATDVDTKILAEQAVEPSAAGFHASAKIPATGRVALVTGGSRGIGAAIAQKLAAEGITVAVHYFESEDSANKVVQNIADAGGSAEAFPADLRAPSAAADLVSQAIQSFGRLDVVVHGASPPINPVKITELSAGDLNLHHQIYAGAALGLIAGASPGMTEQNFGRFIFLGTSAMLGAPPAGWTSYLAAKHALWALVKNVSVELAPKGITANMVSPAMTVTDLTATIPVRAKEVEARRNPTRRLATAEDTAALVAFLAGEGSGYINGVNLPVTGGPC